jgi:hypothetical protein
LGVDVERRGGAACAPARDVVVNRHVVGFVVWNTRGDFLSSGNREAVDRTVRVDVKVTPTVLATIETTVVVEAFGGDTKPIESKDAAASPIMRPTISRDAPMNAFIYGSIK